MAWQAGRGLGKGLLIDFFLASVGGKQEMRGSSVWWSE
jgi:hypothetical protein